VVVEKLAHQEFAEIGWHQEAMQTIFAGRRDMPTLHLWHKNFLWLPALLLGVPLAIIRKVIIVGHGVQERSKRSNLTGPHPNARFCSCAIKYWGHLTESGSEEMQSHQYQPT
jgi:hypothetical protein